MRDVLHPFASFCREAKAKIGMSSRWRKMLHLIETSRLDLLLGVVSNLWLMVFLAFAIEPPARRNPALGQLGLPLCLGLTALIGAGLTTAAISLNDVLDVRHDRTFFPSRPLPMGQFRKRWALLAGMLGFVAALIATWPLGSESITLVVVTGAAIVFYNIVGRFVPSAGVITLAVVYGLVMAIANPRLGFAWPLVLTITHVFVCATMQRSMPGSRPRLRPSDATTIAVAWVFICLMLMTLMNARHAAVLVPASMPRWIWTGPLAAFAAFVVVAVRLMRSPKAGTRAAAQRFSQVANLWLLVYPPVWLLAGERYVQGAVLLGLLLAAMAWRPVLHWVRMHAPGRAVSGYRLDLDRPLRSRG